MAEMEEALRSCMERLVIAREEREQIIVEAANEISSEKKRVRELQQRLEDANKKAARLAAENNSLRKAADAKDALIGELRESEGAAGGKLADATARLEAAQKQAGSLQYEVRMLQKELEVRGQEREYDLKSVDAARRQQAEHLKRIAELEAECQRLRAMVRKRLPGPAAIAKMRDEVEQQQQTPIASPRRPRPATPSSPRSVAPFSPRTPSPSPRRSVSDAEGYAFKLRAVEDENRALKQELAKRESELQFVQMKYADEACKLTVVQRQLTELTEENKQLSDANCQSQSWASALISELEQFRAAKQNGASIMASSEMNLLDDFAEIEKLEMASGDQKRNAPRASSPKKADTTTVTPEKNSNDLVMNGSIPNDHTERVKGVWELVVQKHEASGESIEAILEEIQNAISNKREDSEVPYDRSEIENAVRDLIEKITCMIGTSAGDNVARSGSLLHDKSELCSRLEHLVQVCHNLLDGKAKLEKFIDEVCLTLKYIVGQYLSNQDLSDIVDSDEKNSDEDKSPGTVNTEGNQDIQSAEPAAALDIQKEAQEEEPNQSAEDHIMASHQEKLDEQLAEVVLAQDDNTLPGRKSADCEIESPADEASVQHWAAQEESHSATNSEILAAADKLAECQETITILSKQLQALKVPTTSSGPLDGSTCNPRSSSAKSDYKPQSLASILAEEFANAEGARSPTTPKQEQFKKEEPEVSATPMRSTAQKQNNAGAADKDSIQVVVHPVFAAELRQQDGAPADPKRKKKRGQSLLGRIMFRKRVQ
ncbi:Filament-like plant protein 7 [Dichanthelium oligosanthes]|uniref:Filament-like plant protein 7 n=1 Tax=Dichanthelium oligosanthes TaxID=888268 RepID=A0A1E5V682_9POAL|nr:Filament-like plant protein 7 [Dichanthelium oligosanthes]